MNDIENLVVDANIIISALLGGKSSSLFQNSKFRFLTTAFTVNEVKNYIPFLAKKLGLPQELVRLNLELFPLEIHDKKTYRNRMKKAKSLILPRDPDDVELLALALHFDFPIWSNDKDFETTGVRVYTTARLLKPSL